MALKIKVTAVQNNQIQITDGTKTMIVDRKQLDNQIKAGSVEIDALMVKCLDKQRDANNKITAYLIVDKTGKQMTVEPYRLKNAIYNYQVICVNLTLTSDGRLVDKSEIEESIRFNFEQALEKLRLANKLLDSEAVSFLLNVASTLGYIIDGCWVRYKGDDIQYYSEKIHEELRDKLEANIYCITKNEKEHYIIIPDNITDIDYEKTLTVYINVVNKLIKKLKGTLIIVGGKNVHACCMLDNIKAKTVDLKYFVPVNTEKEFRNITRIFEGCTSKINNANSFVLKEMKNEQERREKEKKQQEEINKKNKELYLLGITDNSRNIIDNINSNDIDKYIFIVKDMNWNNQKCTFDKLRDMLLNGYTALNFRLSADNSLIEYKTLPCNTQYALINNGYIDFEIIDKQSGKIVDKDIIYKKPVDGVEIHNSKLQTLILNSLSSYAVNATIDYEVMKFINHLILEYADHPDETDRNMQALINVMKYKQCDSDYEKGIYNKYKSIADILSVEDITAIVRNRDTEYKDNKYQILENEFIGYYRNRGSITDEYYDKLLKLAGLPSWAKAKVISDLYIIH